MFDLSFVPSFVRCFIKTYIIYSNSPAAISCREVSQSSARPTTVASFQSPVESRLDVIIASHRSAGLRSRPVIIVMTAAYLLLCFQVVQTRERQLSLLELELDSRQQTLPARCVFDLCWPLRCADVSVASLVCVCVCAG